MSPDPAAGSADDTEPEEPEALPVAGPIATPPPTGCQTGPEDLDGFEDDDGCADPDNDHDGVLDADDQCINEPEDLDGFEDDDGCHDDPPVKVPLGA